MAPIYINAENTSAKKIFMDEAADATTVKTARPLIVVGKTGHFEVSFKQGKATLSLFEENDSRLTKLAEFNYCYIAIDVIVEAFCLLMSNLGVDLG